MKEEQEQEQQDFKDEEGSGDSEVEGNMTRHPPLAKLGYLGYNIAAPT